MRKINVGKIRESFFLSVSQIRVALLPDVQPALGHDAQRKRPRLAAEVEFSFEMANLSAYSNHSGTEMPMIYLGCVMCYACSDIICRLI